MCKTCALNGHTIELTMCTNSDLCTVFFKQFLGHRITARFTQLFTTTTHPVMNIKISLNSSSKTWLSTVSTRPITTANRLNFNKTIII